MRIDSVFALGAALLPRATMLFVGLYAVRLLGVEQFGAFSLAYATGIALLQFLPDAVSAYFSRARWLCDGPADVGSIAVDACALVFVALVAIVLAMVPALFLLEPYASNSDLRTATTVLLASSPFFGVSQVLSAQLAINGFEQVAMRQALMLGVAQMIFPVMGAYFGELVGLVSGLFIANVAYAASACINANRYMAIGKVIRGRGLSLRPRGSVIHAGGLVRLTSSLLLGAPVHWFVLRTLASPSEGLYEVGRFSYAYYFYTFLVIIPSSLQSYNVGMLARARTLSAPDRLDGAGRLMGYGGVLAFGSAAIFGVAHAVVSPFMLGDGSFDRLLPGFVCIVSGVVGVFAILFSQVLISEGSFSLQLRGTVVSAVVYAGTAFVAIRGFDLGAAAVAAALGLGQAIQLAYLALAYRKQGESFSETA